MDFNSVEKVWLAGQSCFEVCSNDDPKDVINHKFILEEIDFCIYYKDIKYSGQYSLPDISCHCFIECFLIMYANLFCNYN